MPLLFMIVTSIYGKNLVRNVFQEDHLKFAVRAFGVLIASVRSQLLLRAQFVVLRGTQDTIRGLIHHTYFSFPSPLSAARVQ